MIAESCLGCLADWLHTTLGVGGPPGKTLDALRQCRVARDVPPAKWTVKMFALLLYTFRASHRERF